MRIGIDLDGVVFDSEKEFRIYSELYDMLVLKRNSKIDDSKLKLQDRFNWTDDEKKDFFSMYHEEIMKNSNFMPGAIKILRMLKEEGHTLIVITARGWIEKEIDITKERLKENNMYDVFSKYYFNVQDKAKVCKEENIDIMIEDYYDKVIELASNNIHTIYLKDSPSPAIKKKNKYIKEVYNFGEVYRYIKEREKDESTNSK